MSAEAPAEPRLSTLSHGGGCGCKIAPGLLSQILKGTSALPIPPELLAKVLQKLVRARLLESHQGIRGGYGLARPAAEVSVADVIQAVDGPLTVTACSDEDHSCEQYARCNIRDPLWRVKDRIVAALSATSVSVRIAPAVGRTQPVDTGPCL